MCDTEANKLICTLDNLPDCQQPHQHPHPPKRKEKSILEYKFKNYFPERKILFIENVRIKSLCTKSK